MPTNTINQIEQQQSDQGKEQDEQERVDIPQVGHDHVAKFGEGCNGREHVLIGQAKDHSANEETQKTGNDVVKLTFAATGGASTRSVSCQSHSYPKYQSADNIADNICGGDSWEGDQAKCAQTV